MPLKAQSQAGSGSASLSSEPKLAGLPKRRRRGSPTGSEYAAARVAEVRNRATYNELRVARLRAQLLPAAAMRSDLAWLAARIREIIEASSLPKRDRDDINQNIAAMSGVVDAVAMRQNENEPLPTNGDSNGNGDLAEG